MKENFPFQKPDNQEELKSAEKIISRREALTRGLKGALGFAIAGTAIGAVLHSFSSEEAPPQKESRKEIANWEDYKKLKPKLPPYHRKFAPKIENLVLPGNETIYGVDTLEGKITRTLRWKNIADAVEKKYNLPPYLISAMIMEESTGVDLLANGTKVLRKIGKKEKLVYEGGDGGFGLIHMQGATAHEYGLHTFHNCKAMVCNGVDKRSCKGESGEPLSHAHELYETIQSDLVSRAELIELDERLHPLLNCDAVGRMLASYMSGPQIEGFDPYETALARYAGSKNFRDYIADVESNRAVLSDDKTLAQARKVFNTHNSKLTIDNQPADFDSYIETAQKKNINFGLQEYQEVANYLPKNSDKILAVYGNTIKSPEV